MQLIETLTSREICKYYAHYQWQCSYNAWLNIPMTIPLFVFAHTFHLVLEFSHSILSIPFVFVETFSLSCLQQHKAEYKTYEYKILYCCHCYLSLLRCWSFILVSRFSLSHRLYIVWVTEITCLTSNLFGTWINGAIETDNVAIDWVIWTTSCF